MQANPWKSSRVHAVYTAGFSSLLAACAVLTTPKSPTTQVITYYCYYIFYLWWAAYVFTVSQIICYLHTKLITINMYTGLWADSTTFWLVHTAYCYIRQIVATVHNILNIYLHRDINMYNMGIAKDCLNCDILVYLYVPYIHIQHVVLQQLHQVSFTSLESISHFTETTDSETCVLYVIIILSVMCWCFFFLVLCTDLTPVRPMNLFSSPTLWSSVCWQFLVKAAGWHSGPWAPLVDNNLVL